MTRRSACILACLIPVILAGERPAAHGQDKRVATLVAVVHPSNKVQELGKSDLRNMYLGRRKTWSDGKPVSAYMRPPGSDAGLAFMRTILSMTPARFRHHWQSLELSGQGVTPRTLASATAVVSVVAANEGAIAFLTEAEVRRLTSTRVRFIRIGD
jgi:ABC-type phosphate transport system substrate-binding protein